MINEPRKFALTSLFIGAVTIAVYFSQVGHSWLSPDEPALERDDAGPRDARGNTITGPVTTEPAAIPDDSTAIAGQTYAVPNSQRNDEMTAAQAQPEAAQAANRRDDQGPASPGNAPLPAAQTQPAPAVAQGDRLTQQEADTARTPASTSGKSARVYRPHGAPRGTSNSAYANAKHRRGSESAVAAGNAANTAAPRTGNAAEPVSNGPPDSASAQIKAPAQALSAFPPGGPSEATARVSPTSSPTVTEAGASSSVLIKPEGGPKTRAQVRAELAQARADGSLPAFGNPDPAGPGGAPSNTLLPRQ
jgi:hypothetical protein